MRGNHPLWAELAWRLRTVSCSECSLSMKLGDRDLTALRDRLMEARVRVDTLIGPAAGPFNANAQTRTVPFSLSRIIYGQVGQGALRAGRHEIAARYAEWEIIGPPEIRDVDPGARYFMEGPAARGAMRISERAPQINPHLERPPAIDATGRFSDQCVPDALRDLLRASSALSRNARSGSTACRAVRVHCGLLRPDLSRNCARLQTRMERTRMPGRRCIGARRRRRPIHSVYDVCQPQSDIGFRRRQGAEAPREGRAPVSGFQLAAWAATPNYRDRDYGLSLVLRRWDIPSSTLQ